MVLNRTVLNNFFEILAEEFIIVRQGTYCSRVLSQAQARPISQLRFSQTELRLS